MKVKLTMTTIMIGELETIQKDLDAMGFGKPINANAILNQGPREVEHTIKPERDSVTTVVIESE